MGILHLVSKRNPLRFGDAISLSSLNCFCKIPFLLIRPNNKLHKNAQVFIIILLRFSVPWSLHNCVMRHRTNCRGRTTNSSVTVTVTALSCLMRFGISRGSAANIWWNILYLFRGKYRKSIYSGEKCCRTGCDLTYMSPNIKGFMPFYRTWCMLKSSVV